MANTLKRPQFDLTGQRALITGSSRGIGRAIAEGLAAAGAQIIVNGRDTQALGAAAADLAAAGAEVSALAFDVTDPAGVQQAIAHAEKDIGPIDILINNAGMQHRAPLEDFPPERFDAVMRANVYGPFLVGQALARPMLARGKGNIVNICSLMTRLARPSIAPYTASKGAIANLTKGMAAEWGPRGIRVNGIAPGYFKTELNQALWSNADFNQWLAARTPLARWGNVEELAGAAVFLCSPAASYVNGHILYVDGGMSVTV